jgi:hypothetical protein
MRPIPVAALSNVQTYRRSIVGIAGPNSAEGMDIIFLCLLCSVNVVASAMSWSRV